MKFVDTSVSKYWYTFSVTHLGWVFSNFFFHFPLICVKPDTSLSRKLPWNLLSWLWMLICALWKDFYFKYIKNAAITNENSHEGDKKLVTVSPQTAQSLGCVLWSLSFVFQAEACGNLNKVLEMITAMLIQMSLIETFGYRAKANQILWDASIRVIGFLERKVLRVIISSLVPCASPRS